MLVSDETEIQSVPAAESASAAPAEHAAPPQAAPQQKVAPRGAGVGPAYRMPARPEDLGIPDNMVEDLFCRRVLASRRTTIRQAAQEIGLSQSIATIVAEDLRTRNELEFHGLDGRDYMVGLTEQGRQNTVEAMRDCSYSDTLYLQLIDCDGVYVGISDLDGVGFEFYPNPASTEVNIVFEATLEDLVSLGLYNAAGTLVKSFEDDAWKNRSNDHALQIHLGDVANGLYLLRVEDKGGVSTKRLVIGR